MLCLQCVLGAYGDQKGVLVPMRPEILLVLCCHMVWGLKLGAARPANALLSHFSISSHIFSSYWHNHIFLSLLISLYLYITLNVAFFFSLGCWRLNLGFCTFKHMVWCLKFTQLQLKISCCLFICVCLSWSEGVRIPGAIATGWVVVSVLMGCSLRTVHALSC